jgi:tetratricopeptide (TPR) repeat protein
MRSTTLFHFGRTRVFLLALALALATGGCYNGVSLQIARERAAAGNHEAAMWAAHEALSVQPGSPEARQILETESQAYAADVMARAGSSAASLAESDKAARVLLRFQNLYGISASQLVSELRGQARRIEEGEADRYFQGGERAFASGEWEKARDAFAQALYYRPDHPQARVKLAQAYINIGQKQFDARLYRGASDSFRQALEYSPNDPKARQLLVGSHVELAEWYKTNDYPRQWLAEMETLRSLDPTRPRLSQEIEAAREAATIRLAVLPLKAQTGVPVQVGNYNVPEVARDKVASKIDARKSVFIRMLDRVNTEKLMQEIYFSHSDFAQPGMQLPVEAFEIADTIVTGRLNQMDVNGPNLVETPVRGLITLQLWKEEERFIQNPDGSYVRNPDGSYATQIVTVAYGQVDIPFWYTDATNSLQVSLAGSLAALEAESSRAMAEKSFSLSDGASVHYAHTYGNDALPADTRVTQAQFFAQHIPAEVKQLLNAPRDLPSPESIMQELLDTIATEWAVSILRAIDQPQEIAEPYAQRR